MKNCIEKYCEYYENKFPLYEDILDDGSNKRFTGIKKMILKSPKNEDIPFLFQCLSELSLCDIISSYNTGMKISNFSRAFEIQNGKKLDFVLKLQCGTECLIEATAPRLNKAKERPKGQ